MTEDQYHNKQWGVEDFKRYHSQQMPNAERHALEKAALDDPFLEDALDGYVFSNIPVEDIAALKEKLQPKKEEVKVVVLKTNRRNQLLKIAAILLVFAGLTWLLYPGTKEPSTELATVAGTAPKLAQEFDSVSDLPVITTAPDLSEITKGTLPPGSPQPQVTAIDKATGTTESKVAEVSNNEVAARAIEEKDMVAKQEKTALPDFRKTDNANAVAGNIFKGRVVDNQGAPIPYATVTVPKNNTNVASDVNGVFFFKNNQQPNVLANVTAPGFETANAPLNAGSDENKIILQESPQALSEVVITGYGQSRKKSVTAASTQIKAADFNRVKLRNVRPVGSAQNFEDSLKQLSTSLIQTDTTGYVLLNFDIDATGKAMNIVINKSLCSSCDTAAIQILQKIPVLKRTNKNRPEAQISF